jgi:hypothetical protein
MHDIIIPPRGHSAKEEESQAALFGFALDQEMSSHQGWNQTLTQIAPL